MRLLFVSTEFPPGPGGIGTHAYEIAKHLMKLEWDVIVLTKQENADDNAIRVFNESQPFHVTTVKSQPFKALKFLSWLHQTFSLAKSCKPNVLVASGISAILIAALVARFYRLPLIVVTHGEFPDAWQLRWMRWSCRQAKALVCVSEYTRQQMNSIGIKSEVTTVIPNGGDPCLFRPLPEREIRDFRSSLGLQKSRLLLTVGKVSKRKGQDMVIRALPHILRRVPDTHYFVVGVPACEAEFADLARQLGVSEYVHFTGALDSITLVLFLNSCDVFVMLSRHADNQYEGYGIAVVEAALCGKPAVVSANSGVRESIVPGVTGLVALEGDVLGAADAVVEFLRNEERLLSFGQAARNAALETATWERRAQSYDDLLRKMVKAWGRT